MSNSSEEQKDEIRVLAAIYPENFIVNEGEDSFTMRIDPHVGDPSEDYSSVDLYIKYTPNYPNELPIWNIVSSKGLSPSELEELESLIKTKMNELVGMVMIHMIGEEIQLFLRQHNEKPTSFYEQMIKRQKEEEDAVREKYEKEEEIIKAENEALQQIVKKSLIMGTNNRKKKKEDKYNNNTTINNTDTYDDITESIANNINIIPHSNVNINPAKNAENIVKKKPTNTNAAAAATATAATTANTLSQLTRTEKKPNLFTFNWKKVSLISTDSEDDEVLSSSSSSLSLSSSSSSLSSSSLWRGIQTDTGKFITIREVKVSSKIPHAKKLELIKAASSEISEAVSFRHQHIVNYLGVEWKEDEDTLYILTEYVPGSIHTILSQLNDSGLSESAIRRYTTQILHALNYLHNKGNVYNNLKIQNILFDGNCTIKLSDFVASDIVKYLKNPDNKNYPLSSSQDHIYEEDIKQLGVIVVQMARGLKSYTNTVSPSPSPSSSSGIPSSISDDHHVDVQWPAEYSTEGRDFVNRCLRSGKDDDFEDLVDPSELLSMPFIISDNSIGEEEGLMVPLTPPQSIGFYTTNESTYTADNESTNSSLSSSLSFSKEIGKNISRYESDWEELETIGQGGFGRVVKAKNKLDGRIYAIKKIKFRRTDDKYMSKVLREVVTLSRLRHDHVVRYYQAWIDEGSDHYNDNKQLLNEEDEDDYFDEDSLTNSLECDDSENFSSGDDDDDEKDEEFFVPNSNLSTSLTTSKKIRVRNELSYMPSKSTKKQRTTTAEEGGHHSILYIQMEYCTQTLSNLIENGQITNDETEILRLFRQIVEGLNHIHSQGIIHRDLKPSNIFINRNNVEIGDFGLATADSRSSKKRRLDKVSSSDNLSELTTGIGTPMYLAPEQEKKGKLYDCKVDMYSLGMILFEMCSQFKTSMERMVAMKNLKKPLPELSKKFVEQHPQISEIILLLVDHNPDKRLSTVELLESPFLPAKLEEQILKEAIRSITSNSRSTIFDYLMEKLFALKPDAHQALTYALTKSVPENASIRRMVIDRVVSIFSRHGAKQFDTPLFMLVPEWLSLNPNSVHFLDENGLLAMLPYDLTLPLAGFIAHHQIRNLRRFSVANVFRKIQSGGHPKELCECDFDIIAETDLRLNGEEQMKYVYVSEVLKTITEVMEEFEEELGPYYIKVNNLKLLDGVLSNITNDEDQQQAIIEVLSLFGHTSTWVEIKTELKKLGVSNKAIDVLQNIVSINGTSIAILNKIEAMFDRKNSSFIEGIKDMKAMLNFAKTFGIYAKIHFDISLVYNYNYYEDFVFQAILKRQDKGGIIAAGGKYSSLVERFVVGRSNALKPTSGTTSLRESSKSKKINILHTPISVGVNFNLDRIVNYVKYSKTCYPKTDSVVVLIIAVGKPMIKERVKLVTQLWEKNIKAEYVFDGSMDDAIEHCQSSSIPFLVIYRENYYQRDGTVTVKILQKNQEILLNETDVISYIMLESRQQSVVTTAKPSTAKNIANTARSTTGTLSVLSSASSSSSSSSSSSASSMTSSVTSISHHIEPNMVFLGIPEVEKNWKLKKKLVTTVESVLYPTLRILERITSLKVAAVSIPISILREIAATWDPRTQIMAQGKGRHKTQHQELKDFLVNNKNEPIIIVFSLNDEDFVCIVCRKV
eukprot:TRINITY_DN5117_c1_g1_i1.p1 TRINITY_DN5117_c1_g1~~TRINITY_DN5117_c1_g1_i1.p1  ORF type:complete len:1656 (+),score=455.46 TRINITY_DN5117_c1_g1_i1:21-4988(+)